MRELPAESVKIPKLLRAYLTLGAKICGPPALAGISRPLIS
jgi:putative hemolysin